MKLLIALILAACLTPANANIEVNIKHFSDTSGGDYFKLTSWRGVEIKYLQDDGFYYFLSREQARTYFISPSFFMTFTGVGFGFKQSVTNKINLYGQAGYYITDSSARGRFKCTQGACKEWESLYYAINHKWRGVHSGLVKYDEFDIDSTNAYGVTVGAELIHPLSKNLDLNFGVEWRAMSYTLTVHGMVQAWDYDTTGRRFETTYKGTDSTNFKIGLIYKF